MYYIFSLLTFFIAQAAFASGHVTIYNIPSPHGFNWSNPNAAYWSLKKNVRTKAPVKGIRERMIGHSLVKLECSGEKEVLNGMTMQGLPKKFRGDYFWPFKSHGYGFAILFYTFKGRFDARVGTPFYTQDLARLNKDLHTRASVGLRNDWYIPTKSKKLRSLLSYVKFEVTDKTCSDLVKYYNDFKLYGGNQKYGFSVHPLNQNKELNVNGSFGSGCTEFSTSFLQLAGVVTSEMTKAWQRSINIPNSLIGSPEDPINPYRIHRRKLSRTKLQWGKTEDRYHTNLTFWDPDKMHIWTEKKWSEASADYISEKWKNIKGIYFPLKKK